MAIIHNPHKLTVLVRDGAGSHRPIVNAEIRISDGDRSYPTQWTGLDGRVTVELPQGQFSVSATAFGLTVGPDSETINLSGDFSVTIDIPVGFSLSVGTPTAGCTTMSRSAKAAPSLPA
jgi:hypothetical protein